jgi:hypothetical protein
MEISDMMGRYAGISAGNWPLDGNSNDASGNSNNGTDSNMSYGLGRFGDAGVFNGSSSRIALPNNASLKPTSFTILAWYKGVDSGTILANMCNESSKIYGFNLNVKVTTGLARLQVGKGTGTVAGTDYQTVESISAVNDGNWHFISGSFDGTHMKIYVDGMMEADVTWANAIVYAATQYPMIGVRQDSSGGYATYLTGSADGVTLLPYVLTDQDIRRWYAYSKGLL